jgi:hypothetical protein
VLSASCESWVLGSSGFVGFFFFDGFVVPVYITYVHRDALRFFFNIFLLIKKKRCIFLRFFTFNV